ncbi:MAG TPA: pyridoxal phosphate-dependent aminotransferase, partial [Thermoanaerobaculia bacterium]|nr:pyridoxal phosphate-dependent aminotransferase [Thermoanaerobaculia bacterium]
MSTVRTSVRVSARGLAMPPSPIRKLMPLANEAKARGVHVLHLNIGQPDLETPEPMRRRLASLEEKVYAYSPSNGTPEYLDFLRTYYGKLGIRLAPGEILATTGGSEALLFAFMACSDPGGEIL